MVTCHAGLCVLLGIPYRLKAAALAVKLTALSTESDECAFGSASHANTWLHMATNTDVAFEIRREKSVRSLLASLQIRSM